MKVLKVFLSFILMLEFAAASPGPLGFELGKSTLKDIKEKYSFTEIENSSCKGLLTTYFITNRNASELDGLESAFFYVDENDVVQGFSLSLYPSHYEFALKSLSENYKLIKQGKKYGCKQVYFLDGENEILLVSTSDTPTHSFNIRYHTKAYKILNEKCDKKLGEKWKKEKEKQKKLL